MEKVTQWKIKKADLAGPGIGDYKEIEKILPEGYESLLTQRKRRRLYLP